MKLIPKIGSEKIYHHQLLIKRQCYALRIYEKILIWMKLQTLFSGF